MIDVKCKIELILVSYEVKKTQSNCKRGFGFSILVSFGTVWTKQNTESDICW